MSVRLVFLGKLADLAGAPEPVRVTVNITPARAALTFSVVLAPDVPAARWPWLPLLTGVAVVTGVRRSLGTSCTLKWPNDVLVDGLKVAGILVERVETDRGREVGDTGFPGIGAVAALLVSLRRTARLT